MNIYTYSEYIFVYTLQTYKHVDKCFYVYIVSFIIWQRFDRHEPAHAPISIFQRPPHHMPLSHQLANKFDYFVFASVF